MRERFDDPSSLMSLQSRDLTLLFILICAYCRDQNGSIFERNDHLWKIHVALIWGEELMCMRVYDWTVLRQDLYQMNVSNCFVIVRDMLNVGCIFKDLLSCVIHLSFCQDDHYFRICWDSSIHIKLVDLID